MSIDPHTLVGRWFEEVWIGWFPAIGNGCVLPLAGVQSLWHHGPSTRNAM